MNTKKLEDFKKDLKELLNKYNASISFNCDENSDLYGIYDEKIEFSINGGFKNEDSFFVKGYDVIAGDL